MENHYQFYNNTNIKIWEGTYLDNRFHSFNDKPGFIFYNENGKKEIENWYQNGICYRLNESLPSVITYYENGNIKKEKWLTREKTLVKQKEYYEDGKLKEIVSYYQGRKHDFSYQIIDNNYIINAAHTYYGKTGNENKVFFIYGKAISEKKYIKLLYIFKRKVQSYLRRKREQQLQIFNKTSLYKEAKDISKLITLFL